MMSFHGITGRPLSICLGSLRFLLVGTFDYPNSLNK